MHQNRYLLAVCIAVIALMVLTKDQEETPVVNTETLVASVSGVSGGYAGDDIDESILIKNATTSDTSATSTSVSRPIVKKPYVTAEAYLVGNLETGEVYMEHHAHEIFPIASVSKLYTALVVHHLFDLENPITITSSMLEAYGTAGNLAVDEKFLPNELLYALLLESSNDAAEAFAQSFGYEKFMEQMNAFAQEIGMTNTSFEDSSGLSSSNISNAKDLFVLSRYLYESEKDILEISRTNEKVIIEDADHITHSFINIHPYAGRPDFIGGKTGRTSEAKESMVTMLDYKNGDASYPIVLIVLRSDFGERQTNTDKLLGMMANRI